MTDRMPFYIAFAFIAGWVGGYEAAKFAAGLPPSDMSMVALSLASVVFGVWAVGQMPKGGSGGH